ncbi:MAG: phosphomannomutase/phosphoglucomutase [Candidatus Omnitrophica bacterium]|nr:phosphomannomutase/phosphoglucomutase [Candidatus Omnitrophota bacterium]
MNTHIFREYDIRGIADRDLTDDAITLIGKAYGTYLRRKGKKTVTFGRDARTSSPRIYQAFLKGVLSTGLNVISIGLVTTPCLYFSVVHLKVDGGVMITGSHNPPEHNGLKLSLDTSNLHGAQIQELEQMIERSDFETGSGAVTEKTVIDEYRDYIQGLFKFKRKLKVVVDCGNGMTSLIAPDLLEHLGLQVIKLYTTVDGRFPNHPADPSEPENLKDVIAAIKRERADIGLAFDGDGDRVGVVDHEGNVIPGDKLLVLYSRAVLKEVPGATIIADVKCSNILFQDIKKHGGRGILWKTGHSLIKAKMKEENAILAGEMSGHMFFKHRWFGFDSGIYAACRTLEILDQTGKTIPELLADLPKTYATPEIRVECSDELKFKVVKAVLEDLRKNYKVIDIDGVRVEFPDGWGLVRASNTQPVLVMRFEATSEKRLAEIKNLVEGKIREFSAKVG